MTEAKVIELPQVATDVDGVGNPVDFDDDKQVDQLLHFYAKDANDPLDDQYLQYRKVLEAYRKPIGEASSAARQGSDSFDVAARRVVEIFLHELMLTSEVDRKPNAVWQGANMKRVRALILDGAGLVEVDDDRKSGSARNSAKEAINRRAYNRIDALAALASHEHSHLVQGWKRPGGQGRGTGEGSRTAYQCNWDKPSEALEKAVEIVNEVISRNKAGETARDRAENILAMSIKLDTANGNLAAQMQTIIDAAKARAAAPEQDETAKAV